ncbi:MAG TPA: TIM-barrel domain-containing protein [Gemmatimonadota bacterium]|nr:TIM-barrel domain-containing protein [Gemmatimonadota bacterium]
MSLLPSFPAAMFATAVALLPRFSPIGGPEPLGPEPLQGAYEFIGVMETFERTDRGVELRCAPGVGVRIRFLSPAAFRVTVDRPGREEALLEHALVEREPEPVAFDLVEEAERLLLRTGAIDVAIDRAPCRIAVFDRDGAVISEDDPGMGIGWDGNEVRNWKSIADNERFYGLGEKTGDLDRRGREWVMWNSDTPGYGNETDPLYASVPFFIGVREGRAYGIYFNNAHRTTFNMGAGNHRYYSFAAEGGPLDYFFLYGPDVPAVVEAYTELTGRPPMPPRWALGYQQSRWSYTPAAEVLRIARTFREKEIPADVIYLDIHYMDDYRVFTWHAERFPDPEALLEELEAIGFKAVVIIDPGVKEEPGYRIADEGLDGDHFVRYPDGEVYVGSVWPGRSYFPDFSRPETRAWWGGHLAELADQGVDGIWNDMNEPAVWGKAFPLEVVMDDGGRSSGMKKMHNLYGSLMSQAAWEAARRHRPGERPFVLTRAAFAGIQRYAAVWTGDNVASWEHLELGIRMMLGMGLSGLPFVGTDVGGFIGTPSPELFARWIQVGAFSPLFRAHTVHGSSPQEPWAFGEIVEDVSREAIELRYRMLPTLYTLFREAHRTGHPILRPLFWHHPDDSLAYDRRWQHQFFFGETLLVAPVTREGARLQEVYLPEGEWLDLGAETIHAGGRTVVVEAPLERIPMFLKAGGILVLGEPVQHTGELEDRAAADRVLTVEAFPISGDGVFILYEDDGVSFDHEEGEYRLTRFEVARSGGSIRFVREVEHDGHDIASRHLDLRLHAVETAPREVVIDDRVVTADDAEGYDYDPDLDLLTVRFREAGALQVITIR